MYWRFRVLNLYFTFQYKSAVLHNYDPVLRKKVCDLSKICKQTPEDAVCNWQFYRPTGWQWPLASGPPWTSLTVWHHWTNSTTLYILVILTKIWCKTSPASLYTDGNDCYSRVKKNQGFCVFGENIKAVPSSCLRPDQRHSCALITSTCCVSDGCLLCTVVRSSVCSVEGSH